jgi:hypothetical protein
MIDTKQERQKNSGGQPQTQGELPTPGEWKFLKFVVYGVGIVVALAALGLVINYMTATQATFQSLNNQIIAQSAKIDLLYQECSPR